MGDGPGFAQELAVGIKDNGALTKLDARGNDIDDEGRDALKKAAESRCAGLNSCYVIIHIVSRS
jgi:hypothetical protein